MRVAKVWQVPHSTLTREWSSRDLSLAIASLLAADDVGPCGHPHSVTTRPENIDRYAVRDDKVCGACRAEQAHRASHDDLGHGVLLQVVDLQDPEHDDDFTEFGPVFE